MHEVTFLGHKCTDKGILPDDKKYDVIMNYPAPHDADSAIFKNKTNGTYFATISRFQQRILYNY